MSGACFSAAKGLPFVEVAQLVRTQSLYSNRAQKSKKENDASCRAGIGSQKLSVQEVQGILRHANLTTTGRYVRPLGPTTDRLSETCDRFEEKEAAPKVVAFRAVK